MVNYIKGRETFKPNELGSLHVDPKVMRGDHRPVIYIGGQMEHRGHIPERSGFTLDTAHTMFDGSWSYDYSTLGVNKADINSENFAKNLTQALEMAELLDVDLITYSHGGLIGACATQSDRVHQVYAIHPPITGTPLANPADLQKIREFLTARERWILRAMKLMIDPEYGFQKDNLYGADLSKVNLNKLLVIGSNVDPDQENGIVASLCGIIEKYSYRESDGVVCFDTDGFDRKGIAYLEEETHRSHFADHDDSLRLALQLSRKKS